MITLGAEVFRFILQIQTKWTPAVNDGQVVEQKLVLPIVFKLGDSTHSDTGQTSSQTLEEIVVVGQPSKKN